jgi:general secretion pathway protein M
VIAGLRAWWVGLARRERMMAAAAASFVLLVLLYVVAIEPAWKARQRLAAELPRLRTQAAELHALAQEASQLKGLGIAAESAGAARAALEQSLARAGLQATRIAVLDERRLAVSAGGVSVAQWLAWAEEAARDSRLRIATARISRGPARAIVDAEAVFELAGRQ